MNLQHFSPEDQEMFKREHFRDKFKDQYSFYPEDWELDVYIQEAYETHSVDMGELEVFYVDARII